MNTLNSPLLSVIMSVYNAELYIKEAIDSILNQTFRDFEFIIIEDCSTDNSLKILENYASIDNRICIVKKEKNQGAKGFINNLNLGIKNAKGKYIARMDADDISSLDRFQKQVDYLENNSSIFMVGSIVSLINANDELIGMMETPEIDSEIKNRMINHISMFHPVILFRSEKNIFYREKMYGCEDYDLYLRLMNEGKNFYNFQEPLLKYRILDDSISRKENKLVRWSFVEKARQFYKQYSNNMKDGYDNFNPNNFKNILDKNQQNSEDDIIFCIKSAIKFEDKNSLLLLINKLKKQYPSSANLKYKVVSFLPVSFYKIINKFI
ncbi:glycosyltransferase [Chishuiella sp.]|uniref:glycosyltransferase family 2 protein n=1 Tax=Chishuiella sp. TaxID=1969467 RepID=UPI0028A82D34|nr:glycosyltransferase [Chishuiella sp.]